MLLGVLVTSCYKDKIDPDMLDDLRFNPELEVPLVKARLTLDDIVAKDTSGIFSVGPDDFITVRYRQDDLFTFIPNDFVEIPDQDPQVFPMVTGQPPVVLSMGLGTIGGVELATTRFYRGKMELRLSTASPLSEDLEVKLTIANAKVNGQDLTHNMTLVSGSNEVVDSISLPDVEFDFTNGGQSVNFVSVGLEFVNPPAGLVGDQLSYSIQFQGLELDYTTGYFGNREIDIPSGSFDFDLSGIEELASGFKIENPKLEMLVATNIGLPFEIAPDLDGVNSTRTVTSLDAQAQQVNGATDTIGFDTSIVSFNTNNSKIDEFIAALPSRILYSGKATLNPQGVTTNFVGRNSEISASLDIEFPLEVSIDNSVLEQDLTGIDILSENPEEIEEITLIFRSSNGFPFTLDLNAIFLDENTGDSIYGFNLGLLKAATVAANGDITSRGEFATPREVTFTGPTLDLLKQSDAIRFRAVLNTPGGTPQKFYTHFDTRINIATRVKLNAEL